MLQQGKWSWVCFHWLPSMNTHHKRVSALPVTGLFIHGCTLNTGSKSASSFTQCWCARYFMYPCWERTKVVYSRGKKATIVQCIQHFWGTWSGLKLFKTYMVLIMEPWYTHMYVYWYVSKFCLPQLTFPQTNVAIFSFKGAMYKQRSVLL